MDALTLTFTDAALTSGAKTAVERSTGARGLRSVLESAMLDLMFDLPSLDNPKEVIVSEETITKKEFPHVVLEKDKAKPA